VLLEFFEANGEGLEQTFYGYTSADRPRKRFYADESTVSVERQHTADLRDTLQRDKSVESESQCCKAMSRTDSAAVRV